MLFDLDLGIKLLSFLISIVAMVYAFFANRQKDTDQRFHDGSKRMDRQDARISRLEQTVQTMPGKDDVHALALALSNIGGDIKAMNATMEGFNEKITRIDRVVTRHEDHLIEGGRKL